MHHALIIILIFSFGTLNAQQQAEIGATVSALASRGKLLGGVGRGYAGPPFFSGNLVVKERVEPGFAFEIFREKGMKARNISLKTAVGYLTCGNFLHFDYDYENSVNNIVSIENRFRFITLNSTVKYTIKSKQVRVFAGLGPHLGYLIYATETSRNLVSGSFTESSFNFLSKEKRFNFGPQYILGARYQSFSLEAFYRSFYRAPEHDNTRRVVNFGLGLSYIIKGD